MQCHILYKLDRLPVLRTTSKPIQNQNNMNFQTGKPLKHNSSHVLIPKPHCSSREGINSHCRRFDWLIFAVLVNLSCSVLPQLIRLRRVAGHSTMTALLPAPLVHSTAKCARVGFRDSLWMFFAYTKNARPN